MKATLEFNLPEDQEDFDLACNAGTFHYRVRNFEEWLRAQVKYGNYAEEQQAVFETVKEKFYAALNGEHL